MRIRTGGMIVVVLVAGLLAGAGGLYGAMRAGFLGSPVRDAIAGRAQGGRAIGVDHEAERAAEDGHEHGAEANAHEGHGHDAGHGDERGEAHEDEHEHGEHEGHAEGVVHLTPEKLAAARLQFVDVREGELANVIELPGQVEWNTDRLVHVSPRVAGVVADVEETLGDRVEVNDLLCVLDSREMGDAKMEYLADLSRFHVAEADFERARKVYENTQKLLDLLAKKPTREGALEQAHALAVGRNKNRLLTTYTELNVTQRTYERAKTLFDEGVGTEQDLLEAQGAYERALADYVSTREEIAFDLRPEFLRAERDYEVARTEMRNAERALHILGLTNEQTAALAERADEIDTAISHNPVYSPIGGVIVDRHLTRGELVGPESRLYTIADLSDVWVMGRVYERDIRTLEVGQKATVRLDAYPGELFEGVVDYVGSQLDPATRTVQARVVLPNPERRFRPGMFGAVTVYTPHAAEAHVDADSTLLVPVGALQRVDAGHVVYRVVEDGVFESVPVDVLAKTGELAEVSGGLRPDDRVVIGETFILKSEMGREGMGGGHHH